MPRQFAHVSRSVNMERGFKENHVAMIALHKCGKSDSQIFKLLKPLKISRNFVYRAIKRYKELWRVEDRAWSGHLSSVRAEAAIRTVQEQICRKLLWKQKIMARELNILTQPMSRLRNNQHMRAHGRSMGHLLTPALKEIQRTRAERLLQWHAKNGHENIPFLDEKIFTEEQYNHQKNKIYAQMSHEVKNNVPRVQRGHHPFCVMVCWGVPHQGVTPLHFCKKGVKLVPKHIKTMCFKEL